MPTNRTRTKRTPKTKIPARISKKYRDYLTVSDFLGKLEEHEIPVAAKAGVLKWDLWQKAKQVATLTPEQRRQGMSIAPRFDGYGKFSFDGYHQDKPGSHPPGTKFRISSYEELEAAKSG